MSKSTKIQITLSETAMEKLKQLCDEKGVSKSAIIAIAVDAFYKSEKGEG
jgi:metal-responsive CopG/Arc/MetJ family transcriptional regulator